MRPRSRVLLPTSIRLVLAALLTVVLFPATVLRADEEKEGLQRVTASAVTHRDIVSAGPLTTIAIGVEGSVQIAHSGDTAFEYYPSTVTPGDAGTFLAVGTTLYAPDVNNHGVTATSGLGTFTPFTPVSQTAEARG